MATDLNRRAYAAKVKLIEEGTKYRGHLGYPFPACAYVLKSGDACGIMASVNDPPAG